MSDWFAPKRFGYGAGWPISWQGWALTLLSCAITIATVLLLVDRPALMAAVLFPNIALFVLITARTTRGGWHWRWGGEE